MSDRPFRLYPAPYASDPGLSADVVITDPPYDAHTHARGGGVRRSDGGPALEELPFGPLSSVGGVVRYLTYRTARWIVTFVATRQLEEWCAAFEGEGWDPRPMIWVKPDGPPQFTGDRPGHGGFEHLVAAHRAGRRHWGGGGHKGVYVNPLRERGPRVHPTQKPLSLMLQLVGQFSDPGELVWDPFAGSGTTGVAALRLGRRFLGHEVDPGFADIARERLRAEAQQNTLTGLRAGQTSLFDPAAGG